MKHVQLITYDPNDADTYPNDGADPDEVSALFGLEGGETLVFDGRGQYIGQLTKALPPRERQSNGPTKLGVAVRSLFLRIMRDAIVELEERVKTIKKAEMYDAELRENLAYAHKYLSSARRRADKLSRETPDDC